MKIGARVLDEWLVKGILRPNSQQKVVFRPQIPRLKYNLIYHCWLGIYAQ